MQATGLNHISVNAIDLEESLRFYEELFGLERIPTYTFAFPTQFMRLGRLQLHVFQRDDAIPTFQHFGIDVEDFEAVYARAEEMGIFEKDAFFNHIYELPDGSVQMYIRDPAGNLIEIDWPDVSTLDRSIVTGIKKLADVAEQDHEAMQASLYLGRHEGEKKRARMVRSQGSDLR